MKSEAIEYLPSELRSLDQWVTWQKVHLHGRWTKVPMNPRAGTHARSDDPQTWSSFDVAVEAQQAHRREGIGFVFTAGDPYVGIDLDQALDSSGAVLPWAASILEQLSNDVYVEISPSGRGLHAIVRGSKPGSRCRTSIEAGGGVEIYDQGRYFTMTGDRFGRWDCEVIGNGQTFLDSIYRQLFEPKSQPAATPAPSLESDSVLLDRMFRSRQGGKIEALWLGSTGGYPSASEADLALCSHLWFWTGGDTARIDSLFRSSGLMRPKWERSDYREATIAKAGEGSSVLGDQPGFTGVGHATAEAHNPIDERLSIELPATSEPRTRNSHRANAWRLARHHSAELRYVPGLGYLVYNGRRWVASEARAMQVAAGVSRWIFQEAGEASREAEKAEDDARQQRLSEKAKELRKWARTSEQGPAIRESMKLARALVEMKPGRLDSHPLLLNVENGTVNLMEGELRDHDPADFLTQIAPVFYNRKATSPRWTAFIDEITGGDQELATYLKTALGYSITGSTKEQIIFFAYGDGQNGKSTLFNALRDTLGSDFVGKAAPDLLIASKNERPHPSEIADLRGVRLAISQEVGHGKSFDLQRVKELTGERFLKARQLYGEWFEFETNFKIWMAANHYPEVNDSTHSFWRRVHLVPFSQRIETPDPDLPRKLEAEKAGILNWLIDGVRMYLDEGLATTAEMEKAVAEYQRESDSLGQFLEEQCELEADSEIPASVLWEAYRRFADQRKLGRFRKSEFKRELSKRGIHQGPRRSAGLHYRGVALAPTVQFAV